MSTYCSKLFLIYTRQIIVALSIGYVDYWVYVALLIYVMLSGMHSGGMKLKGLRANRGVNAPMLLLRGLYVKYSIFTLWVGWVAETCLCAISVRYSCCRCCRNSLMCCFYGDNVGRWLVFVGYGRVCWWMEFVDVRYTVEG